MFVYGCFYFLFQIMFDRKLLFSISTVLFLTCYDLNRSYNSRQNTSSSPDSDDSPSSSTLSTSLPPPPKLKMQVVPIIKIRYCLSCGYQNLFKQFSELVQKNYPVMAVVGENYSPGPWKSALAKSFSMIKMVLLVCLLLGQNPFILFRLPTPRIYSWALQNRMYACLMIFFFSNSLESYLISTGAFEISVNDVPLWSKLQTGRIPSANEFVQMLQPFASTNLN